MAAKKRSKILPRPGVSDTGAPDRAPELRPEEAAGVLVRLRERKDEAIAGYLETKNRVTAGELIRRDMTNYTIGKIYAAWTNIIFPMEASCPPLIAAALKKAEIEFKIRKAIGDYAYRAAGEAKEQIMQWLTDLTEE